MSADAPHTVVLAGGSEATRQTLTKQLQHSLQTVLPHCIFLCPASPQDLCHTPADARYLLWRHLQDNNGDESHNAWRTQLHQLQRAYQTVHGDQETVVQQALFALTQGLPLASAREEIQGRWQGICECCADPACEQKLFGRLLQS